MGEQRLDLPVHAFVLLLFASPAKAGETALTGGLPAFPPFFYEHGDQPASGAVVDVYRLLSEQAGIPIKVVKYPYARNLQLLKQGKLDLAIIFKNPTIAEDVSYVARVSDSRIIVLTRAGFAVTGFDDLHHLQSVGVVRKASIGWRFDNDPDIRKVWVNNYTQAAQMLNLGRLEAVVGSRSGVENAADGLINPVEMTVQPYTLASKEWWLHMSRRSPHQHLLPRLRAAVEALYQPELIYCLYRKRQGCHLHSGDHTAGTKSAASH